MLVVSSRRSLRRAAALLAVLACTPAVRAARPTADSLLPAETVGLLRIGAVPDFRKRWAKTQLGELSELPSLKPFLDDLTDRLDNKVGGLANKIGVTIRDFGDVATGEAAVAMIGPTAARPRAAVVAMVDATGRDDEAQQLVAKIAERLQQRGGVREPASDDTLLVYRFAPDPEEAGSVQRRVVCFQENGWVVAADDDAVATTLRARLAGGTPADGSLAELPAYAATLKKARKAARGGSESITWFLNPFGYDAAARSTRPEDKLPEKKDRITLLREQGFDGIRSLGGVVEVGVDDRRDFLHHTAIHAPPKPGATGSTAAEKYTLALRMLELPNEAAMDVEPWAPAGVAAYKTLRIEPLNAFDHVGTLVSAFAGYDNAFETILEYFENDPYGPKINLRNEIVAYLGERVVMMTDHTRPITPESERYLIVFDVTDADAVREPLGKWMANDGAELKAVDGVAYWELVPEEELAAENAIDPILPPLDAGPAGPARDEERVFQRAAVCLHDGRLVVGSDVEFLKRALFGVAEEESLGRADDFTTTLAELRRIAPGDRCGWTFTRTDQTLGAVYELIRTGKMPESESFFGRLLNRLLTTDEQQEVDAVREQRLDGSTLPPFAQVERFLGPAARTARTDADGWTISGVMLRQTEAAGPAATP